MIDDSQWATGLRRTLLLLAALLAIWAAFYLWRVGHMSCVPFARPGHPQPSDIDYLAYYVLNGTLPVPIAMLLGGAWVALGAGHVRWRIAGLLVTVCLALFTLWLGWTLVGACT